MAHLGELLAELRQDHGLTQDQLAEIISVSPGTISNYEDGRHLPDLDKLKMIADYFHVTTDYLLGRTSSSIPIDLLQKRLADGKTVSDLISIFLNYIAEILDSEEKGPELLYLQKEDAQKFMVVFHELDAKDQYLLTSRFVEGKSYSSMASDLGIQPNSVRMAVTRAKRRTFELLKQRYPDEK